MSYFLLSHCKGDAISSTIINHQSWEGQETALWVACDRNHAEVVRVLLQAGADPSLPDRNGVKPMDTARQHGYRDCIKVLEVRALEGGQVEHMYIHD